jgi:hypothetical protein
VSSIFTRIASLISLVVLVILTALAALTLSACQNWNGEPIDANDLSYANTTITITGLADKPFKITPTELAKLDCVNNMIETKNSYNNTVRVQATGPLLTSFIESQNANLSDFSSVKIVAADGYKVELTPDDLATKKYVLAIRTGDEPLKGEEIPLRLISPDTKSSYWVSGIKELEFIR